MKANIEILDRGTAYERYPHLFELDEDGGFDYGIYFEVLHGLKEDWVDYMPTKFVAITTEEGRLLYFLNGEHLRLSEVA